MSILNNFVCVKPLEQGPFGSSDSNEFEVLDSVEHAGEPPYQTVSRGEIIIVEADHVIKTLVKNKERFYVKEENIIEVFDGPDKNDPGSPA